MMNFALNMINFAGGAGMQGRKPNPPLTKANHCANVVATANMSLPEVMAAHFKPVPGQ